MYEAGQRPSSIKTRIKTSLIAIRRSFNLFVRDHLPLKQGLRLVIVFPHIRNAVVRDHLPLKQGLRRFALYYIQHFTHCQRPSSIKTRIKTPNPLSLNLCSPYVRDHLPLKQGLRLLTFRNKDKDVGSETIFH